MSRIIPALVAALLAWSNVANATFEPSKEPRCVGLVIGNNAYEHAPKLYSAVNDANAIGNALTRLGFSVQRMEDADHAALRHGLREFSAVSAGAEFSVVFYAGHGFRSKGRDFLVPVDAHVARPIDVELDAVPLDLIVRVIQDARGFGLIILDAHFPELGFEPVESVDQHDLDLLLSENRAIAYGTRPGMIASEGEGANSPFTNALLAHIEEPGLDIDLMFRMVREGVLAETGGVQEPNLAGRLPGRAVYIAPLKSAEGEAEAQCGQDWLLPSQRRSEEPKATR